MAGPFRLADLSRAVSHALRHEPGLYALELDAEGWVSTRDLVIALRREKPEWASLDESDLALMIAQSDKTRHELRDHKIRALYGHTTAERLHREAARPPEILYHGTSPEAAARIGLEGLRPMQRHHVHLSPDVATAERVGRRKAKDPVILVVAAEEAWGHGARFYLGNDNIWLADAVLPEFISEFKAR